MVEVPDISLSSSINWPSYMSVVKAEAALCVESDGIHRLDLKES